MADHIANRERVLQALRQEVVGPAPLGQEIDCTRRIVFTEATQSYGPWRQLGSGEEILQRDAPRKRYGVGVLYPLETSAGDEALVRGAGTTSDEDVKALDGMPAPSMLTEHAINDIEKVQSATGGLDADTYDFDLSTANLYMPSSMAVSFLVDIQENDQLIVEASGGRYHRIKVRVEDKERDWWLRSPVSIRAEFSGRSLSIANSITAKAQAVATNNLSGLDVRVEVFTRTHASGRIITVCLINRQQASNPLDELCLFQAHFKATVISQDGQHRILPYPGPLTSNPDEEEQSFALLYRNARTFAVGHGCAADWGIASVPNSTANQDMGQPRVTTGLDRVAWASAEALPVVETPSITPDIKRNDGTRVEVAMAALAGLVPGDDGYGALSEIIELYEQWIKERKAEAALLEPEFQAAAARHLTECQRSVERMRDGLLYLKNNMLARKAFQLANHAILLQQTRSQRPRKVQYDPTAMRLTFSEPYTPPDPLATASDRGKWRAFQVAFLLMSLRSAVEGSAPDRSTVELIWFPTGGGKTEAYLGLSAFALFMRRLNNTENAGVHVLMRYTLRLLTAQQFQRACGLICAMEYLRKQDTLALGQQPFSIGIWLGDSSTPNKRSDARSDLANLQRGNKFVENRFVLNRCPWCGTHMGPLEYQGKVPAGAPRVIGYELNGNTVMFKCPDSACAFATGLPIYVIDEDIYEKRPSLVIGTVDKFATLAWQDETRALFGIARDGTRQCSPPGLIIQDELHLISGPLGSMVGLFEGVIEELCTDHRGKDPVPPKIVSSTATIRRYTEQIKALYGRRDVALFPPPGLDAGDSFFAQYARWPDGRLKNGRKYVGIHAPGLGSLQTVQVRTFTALLQAPVPLTSRERDPWWTLLLFFNSLRELGTTLSLFQSDIPDYFGVVRNRQGFDFSQLRRVSNFFELTGRLRSEEVPRAIASLEVPSTSDEDRAVDVCLASSIIEVGIDIDRLSMMAVVGQPKTTSQYIQVTGRVGRRWEERPGLVATIYSASKPRDRSHFEKFRSYHERLYAQVEPTSVTPFSPPVLDRALHAIMVAYVRQVGDRAAIQKPYPYPEKLIDVLKQVLLPRIEVIDPEEVENFKRVFARRAAEWKQWQNTQWEAKPLDPDVPLLRRAGAYATRTKARQSWSTPMSMRNVDAECRAVITKLYSLYEEGSDAK